MTYKIIINAIGTLGDLHPLIAVAQALRGKGVTPIFATSHDHVEKIRSAGFEAHGIVKGHLEIAADLGFTEEAFMRELMTNQKDMMGKFILDPMPGSVREIEKLMGDVDAVIGSPFSLAGQVMADKYERPFIMTVLQPGLMLSYYNPMVSPDFPMLIAPAKNPVSRMWNRAWIGLLKFAGRYLFSKAINAVRAEFGAPLKPHLPIFSEADSPLYLGLYSDVLGGVERDMYPQTQIAGFPIYDSATGEPPKLDPELEAFLGAGPPPLVFGLGSLAFHAAGDFFEQSIVLAKSLDMRAVLLTGQEISLPLSPDIFAAPYAPHSELFPRAAAIIHHGGIGSTGRALASGKPQLIVPINGDQFDNARRVKGLGIGKVLPLKKYNATRAEKHLRDLLGDAGVKSAAEKIGQKLARETGAQTAAAIILDCLDRQAP